MWRADALFQIIWRTVRYSVVFGTPGTVVFVLFSAWQSYGSYWPSAYHTIVFSAALGVIVSALLGLIVSIAMVASAVVFFPRIENRRRFQSIVGMIPLYLVLLAHVLLNTEEKTAAYIRLLVDGPAWIRLHFVAFLIALVAAILLCRYVAGKYASEVSPRKHKQHT